MEDELLGRTNVMNVAPNITDFVKNKLSNFIRRYIDNMKLLFICILLLSHSLIFFRFYFLSMYIYGCIPV
jgi:hypothetical protein